MKKTFKFALMFFAAAAMVCCNDNTTVIGGDDEGDNPGGNTPGGNPGGDTTETLTINFLAPMGTVESRTQINATSYIWTTGDVISVAEVAGNSTASIPASSTLRVPVKGTLDNNKTASFSIEVPENDKATSFKYLAVYPYTALTSFEPGTSTALVTMPANQTASATSVDPNATLLVGASNNYNVQPGNAGLQFKHVGAYGALVIENLQLKTNAYVTTVEIKADKPLSGPYTYNYADPAKSSATGGGSVKVNVSGQNYKTDNNTLPLRVLFAALPVNADKYTITVAASNGSTYTVDVDASLTLEAGTFTTITLDMGGLGDDQSELPQTFKKLNNQNELILDTAQRYIFVGTVNGKKCMFGNGIQLGLSGQSSALAPYIDCEEAGITFDGDTMTGIHMDRYCWKITNGSNGGYKIYDEESYYLHTYPTDSRLIVGKNADNWGMDFYDGHFRVSQQSYGWYITAYEGGRWGMCPPGSVDNTGVTHNHKLDIYKRL